MALGIVKAQRGSSPRARGAVEVIKEESMIGRFIPACAGSSRHYTAGCRSHAVHPRVRGEQFLPLLLAETINGSSPRARGAGNDTKRSARPHRFIPACAGSSVIGHQSAPQCTVHPRVRGEQGSLIQCPKICNGSSPRARGAVISGAKSTLYARFIPACAGSSAACGAGRAGQAVHPRVRGEQPSVSMRSRASRSSSPRARGAAIRVL